MKKLFTDTEYNNTKSNDKLLCECYNCNNSFNVKKKYITHYLTKPETCLNKNMFCSNKCRNKYFENKVSLNCKNCNKSFYKTPSEINKSKSGNHFCSKSCAATYNNKHKTTGTRRSKLEIWLENQLNDLYPNINILFNDKETIKSELDIYIPSLSLAFELNGIFHYEPIYGEDKLQQIQENDQSKTKACHEHKIDLCIIDTSQQKYFKPKSSQKYLNIITQLINQRTR